MKNNTKNTKIFQKIHEKQHKKILQLKSNHMFYCKCFKCIFLSDKYKYFKMSDITINLGNIFEKCIY